jgi:hypothetical protein
MALGMTDRVWTIAKLLDAALATQSITPVPTAPDRRQGFRVIEGGRRNSLLPLVGQLCSLFYWRAV